MKQRFATIALATALVAGADWWVSGTGTAPTATGQAITLPGAVNAQEADSGEAADATVQEMVLGAKDAPVEMIEYASYTCPHCATFHDDVFEEIKRDYIDTGKVKFTYREVYFDQYGLWGSIVARCGGEDRFFGITDMIYDTQDTWFRAGSDAAIAEELRKIGRNAGLERYQLEACLSNNEKARSLVKWSHTNAEEHGINSTPSFVIDGETYSNMSYDEFQDILRLAADTNPLKIKGVGLGQAEAPCSPQEATYVDIIQKPVRIQMECTFGSRADRVKVVFSVDGQSVVRVERSQYLTPSDPEPAEIVKAAVGFYGAPDKFDEGNWLANYGNAFRISYNGRNASTTMNSSGTGLLIKGYLCGDGRYGTEDCGNLGTRLISYDLIDVEAFNKQVKDGELAQQEKVRENILKQEF